VASVSSAMTDSVISKRQSRRIQSCSSNAAGKRPPTIGGFRTGQPDVSPRLFMSPGHVTATFQAGPAASAHSPMGTI